MKKFLIALAAALILCVPAFAADVYFSDNLKVYNGDELRFEGYSATDVYYYAQHMSSFIATYAISTTQNAPFSYFASGSTYSNNCSVEIGDGVYNFNPSAPNYTLLDPDISIFPANATNAEISQAFLDFLNNIPVPDPAAASSFTLPRGNVLYFQVESEQDVHFTSYMDTLSNIINFNTATYGAWGDTGQRYGEAAALPTAGTVFPLLSQSPIAWQKDSSTNILGQTKVGLATKHCIAGQWYCFYNPNANHIEGADPYNASPGASVVVQGSFSQIKVYPVNQKLSVVDGDLYSGSNDDFDSYYDGTIDQDGTVTWTNQDGNIEAPAAGGQNFEDGPKSATSLLEGIRVTLETVVHELQTLFTFGYSAIQSLVGIMSDFVSVFSGLYTWLPAEVYSALMSAVVVAIVIGVFKVFL